MKKIMSKLNTLKSNTVLASVLGLLVVAASKIPDNCFFLFYEPKKPEGIDDIKLKDILPIK